MADADYFADETDSLDRLMTFMNEAIEELAGSGIFGALDALTPTTLPTPARPDDPAG